MARLGDQTPTYTYCAEYTRTQGNVAAALSTAYALRPHPWQRMVLDDWLALDDGGKLLNNLCILFVSRQQGKTGCCDPRETYGLIVRGERILHTAQEGQTSEVAFDRLREKFGECRNDPNAKYPELNRLVRKYTRSRGQMILDLTNGGHIEFRTRGKSGNMGRGGTYDLVVIDEAQIYTDQQDAALSPLNSAAPLGNPQTILMGTVPNPEKPVEGEVFNRLIDAAHNSPYPGMCIHEWSAGEVGDVLDESRWYRYNPSLGYQLLPDALRKDARGMSPEKFAQEHLGWRGLVTMAAHPISRSDWEACAVGDAPDGRLVYAVKFDPGGDRAVVAVCVIPKDIDLRLHVEVAEVMGLSRGVGCVADYLCDVADFAEAIVVDGKSNAQTVGNYTGLVNAVRSRTLTHNRDEALDAAAIGCGKRFIGSKGTGGYGFESEGDADAMLVEAIAHAHGVALGVKREPAEELEVW
jgi:hypothetical protein